jgi:hypothetical protein
LESVLTIVGGKVVYAAAEFARHSAPALPVSPDWSPVKTYGGHWRANAATAKSPASQQQHSSTAEKFAGARHRKHSPDALSPWWFGCGCFI